MNNFNKHEFDEIFRSGLTAPDLSEVDEDWALMKARLQKDKTRNKVPYYMIFVSSVAAVLLLVFSVMFNSTESTQDQGSFNANTEEKGMPDVRVPNNDSKIAESIQNTEYTASQAVLQSPELVNHTESRPQAELIDPVQDAVEVEVTNNNIANSSDTSSNTLVLTAPAPPLGEENSSLAANMSATENPVSLEEVSVADNEEANQKSNSSKNRFSLAINFAPDLNGVERFQSNKVSYSIGAGLIYNISNKLSIEAGAAYGKKTYQTGFSSFRPASYSLFQVKPNVVSSGFDVMDISLNLAYTLLNKGKSSIGFGVGISSYLMLDEQYSFTYQNMNARGLSSFSTGYQNNHFFGIANLNLSYKRNLTNNVKLAFNPYLKLPLTDLGYGNIRLRSAGMSVGVITNLNKSKK